MNVTIKTGGVIVGRRNRTFDLDAAAVVLDLVRRRYHVFIRGTDEHQQHLVMLRLRGLDDRLELNYQYGERPVTSQDLRDWGTPGWWDTLHTYLTRLDPELFNNRITNYPLDREESCPTH